MSVNKTVTELADSIVKAVTPEIGRGFLSEDGKEALQYGVDAIQALTVVLARITATHLARVMIEANNPLAVKEQAVLIRNATLTTLDHCVLNDLDELVTNMDEQLADLISEKKPITNH